MQSAQRRVDGQSHKPRDDPWPGAKRIVRYIEPHGSAQRIFLVAGTEHALRYITTPAGLCAGIPGRPPLHAKVCKKSENRQRPDRAGGESQMEVRKKRQRITSLLSCLMRGLPNQFKTES